MAAYVIVEVSVTDPETYERYKPLAADTIAAHGGTYRVRGGAVEVLEGEPPAGRVVVLEFPTMDAAREWYRSEDYGQALRLRHSAAQSRMFIVEGTEP